MRFVGASSTSKCSLILKSTCALIVHVISCCWGMNSINSLTISSNEVRDGRSTEASSIIGVLTNCSRFLNSIFNEKCVKVSVQKQLGFHRVVDTIGDWIIQLFIPTCCVNLMQRLCFHLDADVLRLSKFRAFKSLWTRCQEVITLALLISYCSERHYPINERGDVALKPTISTRKLISRRRILSSGSWH